MDISGESLIDAYNQYRNNPIGDDVVLGFDIDHRLHNFSMLGKDYTFENIDLQTRQIPGMMLKEAPGKKPTRSVRQYTDAFLIPVKNVHVGVNVIYNGSEMLITEIYGITEGYIETVRYIEVVLLLHKIVTGTGVGLYSYKRESELALSSIPPVRYTPIAVSYVDLLNKITDATVSEDPIRINPKHDGVAMWLYVSSTTPLSLLYQVKTKSATVHRYIGRVADLPDISVEEKFCVMVERVSNKYIATDCFTDQDMDYPSRINNLLRFSKMFLLGDITPHKAYGIEVHITEVRGLSGKIPLNVIMGNIQAHTDGFVVYIGNGRPLKVKLSEMCTIDVEYNKRTNTYSDVLYKHFPSVQIEKPDENVLLSSDTENVVVEVNVHTGKVVRTRPDRTKGNSEPVVASMAAAYRKDMKYSIMGIWSGVDVRFSILVNRTFKRYMHLKYMQRKANVLDVGSGNGGDFSIWKQMEYRILAVERDPARFTRLRERLSKETNMRAVQGDMRDMMKHLGASAVRYHNASFMRSLSNICKEEIVHMLGGLRTYGCTRILIVTMIRDNLQPHTYINKEGQWFNITPMGNTVSVEYHIDGEPVGYTDNCYSLGEWETMCRASGYDMRVEMQSAFVSSAFSLVQSPNTYPCFTDAGLILTKHI
jgi:hypothetical protein